MTRTTTQNNHEKGGDMTPTTEQVERCQAIVPTAERLEQADRLDTLAEALRGLSPQDAGVALRLQAIADRLRC